jgi:hypothetical protein
MDWAFYNCVKLKYVSFSGSCYIGSDAFFGCSMDRVCIPGGGVMGGFEDCKIKTVILGEGVTGITRCAFFGSPVSTVTCLAPRPPAVTLPPDCNSFSTRPHSYVLIGCGKAYHDSERWRQTVSGISEIDSLDINYTLTYLINGRLYKQYQLCQGAIITPEEEPLMEEFSGWSEIPSTMPNYDVIVTGVGIEKYTLKYMVDGEVYKTYTLKEGDTIIPEPEPTKDGYTFSGWSEIPSVMPNHDVTIIGTFINGDIEIVTCVFTAYSQPPIVGGVINDYFDGIYKEKGIIVSDSNEKLGYDANSKEDVFWTFNIKDFKVIDCTEIGKEQFWCPILNLKSDKDYYVKAYAIQSDGSIVYGQVEKIHTQNFDRYNGNTDYANVYYATQYTLFDLVTDEIISSNDGYYGSTNENPTKVAFKPSYPCYKFKTEWNYKLWYYNGSHCVQSKKIHSPLISQQGNKLYMEKNPLDSDKNITIYYSINGDYFRPENFNNIYSSPIEISEPCTVYCYAINSDDYLSYTNMYMVKDINSSSSISTTYIDSNKEGWYYNLQGQRVINPKNGIYIVNGKKVFIK